MPAISAADRFATVSGSTTRHRLSICCSPWYSEGVERSARWCLLRDFMVIVSVASCVGFIFLNRPPAPIGSSFGLAVAKPPTPHGGTSTPQAARVFPETAAPVVADATFPRLSYRDLVRVAGLRLAWRLRDPTCDWRSSFPVSLPFFFHRDYRSRPTSACRSPTVGPGRQSNIRSLPRRANGAMLGGPAASSDATPPRGVRVEAARAQAVCFAADGSGMAFASSERGEFGRIPAEASD
jgi:hypothetical protein